MTHLIGRRLLIPVVASGLLLAATASSAFAKCEGPNPPDFCKEVVASMMVGGSGYFSTGVETFVDISVTQGEQPYDAQGVFVTFGQPGKTAVRVRATATGMPGIWRAVVTLPEAGNWMSYSEVVDAQGVTLTLGLQNVQAVGPAPEPPAATPVPPAPPSFPTLPVVIGLGLLAAAGALAFGMRQRTRRQSAPGLAAASQSERSA
jgi:hypothetical protein